MISSEPAFYPAEMTLSKDFFTESLDLLEEADELYDNIIDSNFFHKKSDHLKTKLLNKKSEILLSLQKWRDAGFSDIVLAQELKKGAKELQDMCENFNQDYSVFQQEHNAQQSLSQTLAAKIDNLEARNILIPAFTSGTGALTGDLLEQKVNLYRSKSLLATDIAYKITVDKFFETHSKLHYYNTLSKNMSEMPPSFQKSINEKIKKLDARTETLKNKFCTLAKKSKKLEHPIPRTKFILGGGVIGGAIGVVLDVVSSDPAY